MKPKVFISIFRYACERRELDARRILEFFKQNNYPIVYNAEKADVIVYISCGIIEKNTEASLAEIRELQKYNARLIVGGCVTDIDTLRLRAVHSGETFSTKNLAALDDLFPGEQYPFNSISDANCRYRLPQKTIWAGRLLPVIEAIPGVGHLFRMIVRIRTTSVFGEYSFAYLGAVGLEKCHYVRIADGCLSNCSYCAVPAAIGRLRSKSASQCIDEFKQGLDSGCKNITITADDTGVWGADLAAAEAGNNEASNIAELLGQMVSCGDEHGYSQYAIVLSGLNPASLWRHLDSLPEVFMHPAFRCVVVPVQSLNKRLLTLMRRFSDIDKIRDSLCALRTASPSLWISTHILVGFPSETEDEFWETLFSWERLPFDEGQFFAYSFKPGTPAEMIGGRLEEEEIRRRMRTAHDYCKRKRYACFFRDYELLLVSKKPVRGANNGS
ncbi:MAG: radical SAM protein [Clostridiales bacterium]|nr:radical SAM protein [Clostridiales bacterium]